MKTKQNRSKQAKQNIFEKIEALLEHGDLSNITFARIARLCNCQPNSIYYYFDNKMDMLLQFTQYYLEKDEDYQSAQHFHPSQLPAIESFCRKIDNIFDRNGQKSRIRLLSNYFIVCNASLSAEFSRYMNHSVQREADAVAKMVTYYNAQGILCGEHLRAAYGELCLLSNALSLFHIFAIPFWNYEQQAYYTRERLKAAFLKEGCYTAPTIAPNISIEYPLPLSSERINKSRLSDNAATGLRKEIFDAIASLLEKGDIHDITFSQLANQCYCQPSSITYYFKDKMDMLLQFTQYYLEMPHNREPASVLLPAMDTASYVEDFCQFIDRYITGFFRVNNTVYWINYIVVCNLSSVPEWNEYMEFYMKRRNNRCWEIVNVYCDKGILQEETINKNIAELCFICDSIALMHLFQMPITDREFVLSSLSTRLKAAFLKPEFLP